MQADFTNSRASTTSQRSTLAMLSYLSRPRTSGGNAPRSASLPKLLAQEAICRGTVADQRRQRGRLRDESKHAQDAQLLQHIEHFASALREDAEAAAREREKVAARAALHTPVAAAAARHMGAVVPQSTRAQKAASAVVPFGFSSSSVGIPARSPPKPALTAAPPAAPPSEEARTDVQVTLRSRAVGSASAEGREYVTRGADGLRRALGTADAAAAAPWRLRAAPGGAGSLIVAPGGGGRLYATADGKLCFGQPPQPECALWVLQKLPPADQAAVARRTAAEAAARVLDDDRPASAEPRRKGSRAAELAATAVTVAVRPRSAAAAKPPPAVAPPDGALVRVYQPASRTYLHITDGGRGTLGLLPAAAAQELLDALTSADAEPADTSAPPSPVQPGLHVALPQPTFMRSRRAAAASPLPIIFELTPHARPPAHASPPPQRSAAPKAAKAGSPPARRTPPGRPLQFRSFDMTTGADPARAAAAPPPPARPQTRVAAKRPPPLGQSQRAGARPRDDRASVDERDDAERMGARPPRPPRRPARAAARLGPDGTEGGV